MPLPLKKLPETYGLDTTMVKKGDFPHLINTDDYANYEGKMPPQDLWHPECMSAEHRVEFEAWYNEKVYSDYVFKFKDELLEYCKNDGTV